MVPGQDANGRLLTGPAHSSRRHHAREAGMDLELRALINNLSPAMWRLFSGFGYSGGIDCIPVSGAWTQTLSDHGVTVTRLVGGPIAGSPTDGGGYLRSPGRPAQGHAWLAVGRGLWLFDPTWAQYRRFGPPTLTRYLLPGGQAFEAWRAGQR